MQFIGLTPLREDGPAVEMETSTGVVDLHNDAVLREMGYSFRDRVLRLTWAVKRAAWEAPELPDPASRQTVAALTLTVDGVRQLSIEGDLAGSRDDLGSGLDYWTYERLAPGLGELRLVFESDAVVAVTGSQCRVDTVLKATP